MTQYVTPCMLTGLPIQPNETCVGFLISRRQKPDPAAGPHEKFWRPLTPAMWGTYDGFGNFVGIRAPAGTTRVLTNAAVAVTLPDGTDMKIQESNSMLNLAIAAAIEGTAMNKSDNEELALVLVKEQAYRSAIDQMETSTHAPALVQTREVMETLPTAVRTAIKACALSFDDARELYEFGQFLRLTGHSWFPTAVGSGDNIDGHLILGLYREMYQHAMAAFAGNNQKEVT